MIASILQGLKYRKVVCHYLLYFNCWNFRGAAKYEMIQAAWSSEENFSIHIQFGIHKVQNETKFTRELPFALLESKFEKI